MPLRVVVDCNVYMSLLIGGSMVDLRDHLLSDAVELILSRKLIAEIEEQTTKTKFAKYFKPDQAVALVRLLLEIGELHGDQAASPAISRDPDDDYLLALAMEAKADVLLTGDKDLLILAKHGRTKILSPTAFRRAYFKGK